MKALLVDLDDTLLDYSRGIDVSWREACEAMCEPCGVDPCGLPEGIAAARRWFWDESGRHREGRRDMMRAWAIIAARALEQRGAPNEALAQAVMGTNAADGDMCRPTKSFGATPMMA